VTFDFDNEKNEILYRKRGVTFQMVIGSIADHGILLDFDHPNQQKYPKQRVLVVDIDGYAYCVPYVVNGSTWFLKTIYPSRSFKHLLKGEPHA
jgi:uncharacterized DUF497 family protein